MANHKSAAKRARQTIKKTAHNKTRMSQARTAMKKIRTFIAEKNKEQALVNLPLVQAILDKFSKTGLIKTENASRKVGRLTAHISKL